MAINVKSKQTAFQYCDKMPKANSNDFQKQNQNK